ncbi:MAG: hypothetical protein MI746_08550 [Pseudomonadales bacterium]|nr:hypothetical protein [Pseudomonadales bacterium]
MKNKLLSCFALLLLVSLHSTAQETDSGTGLIMAEGWETVRATCTECHSAQLITSNSGSRAVWKSRILWMQDTQGLQQLTPDTENTILTYLADHYGQKEATRRAALPTILMPENPYPILN